jgi:hypothetical protein
MHGRHRFWLSALCGLLIAMSAPGQVGTQDSDLVEAGVRQLARAITSQRNGSHLPRLAALRQLRDPALKPLFERLTFHDEWQIQVHATLGLAALTQPPRLSFTVLARLHPQAQEATVAEAIDLGWVDVASARNLLATPDLPALPRLLLLGELVLAGEPIDDTLIPPPSDDDLQVDALASCLIAKQGDLNRLNGFANRLTGLSLQIRHQYLQLQLEMLRQFHVDAAADWILVQVESGELPRALVQRAILALLCLDAEQGLELWRRRLSNNPSQSQRVRFGLLLLGSSVDAPDSMYDLIDNDDPLVHAIASLGRALATDSVEAGHFIDLFDLEHRRSVEWALIGLKRLPADVTTGVYLHLLNRLADRSDAPNAHKVLGVTATQALMDSDPDALLRRLEAAEDDGLQQQVILLGLFDSNHPDVEPVVTNLRRIGMGYADALTLVMHARHTATLPPADLQALGRLAAGGSTLSDSLRTQAAWLYLKHADRLAPTMTELFDKPPVASP